MQKHEGYIQSVFEMPDNQQGPATKADIQQINKRLDQHDEQFKLVLEYIKNDGEETRRKMEEWKDETKQHFDVISENIKHDLLKGALNDKIEQHDDRIVRLEKHAGLARV